MTFHSVSFLVIVFVVCADSVTLRSEIVGFFHLLGNEHIAGMDRESFLKNMTDIDKDCFNWYWEQILLLEEQEKTKLKCDSCQSIFGCEHMTVKCITAISKSKDNCCLSLAVLDRIDSLRTVEGKNTKCNTESGVTEYGKTTSDQVASIIIIWMIVWIKPYVEPYCDSKCREDSDSVTDAALVNLRSALVNFIIKRLSLPPLCLRAILIS